MSLSGMMTASSSPRLFVARPRSFLLFFNLQEVVVGGAEFICCGVVGEGSRFCSKLDGNCVIRDHWSRKKMYDVMEMEDGFYINDAGVGRSFG